MDADAAVQFFLDLEENEPLSSDVVSSSSSLDLSRSESDFETLDLSSEEKNYWDESGEDVHVPVVGGGCGVCGVGRGGRARGAAFRGKEEAEAEEEDAGMLQ